MADFSIVLPPNGSWLRRHRARCERCHRLYLTLAVTTAACPQCGEPGPFIVACSPIEVVPRIPPP
jgi:rRNA maturation endonuclease Nob1